MWQIHIRVHIGVYEESGLSTLILVLSSDAHYSTWGQTSDALQNVLCSLAYQKKADLE